MPVETLNCSRCTGRTFFLRNTKMLPLADYSKGLKIVKTNDALETTEIYEIVVISIRCICKVLGKNATAQFERLSYLNHVTYSFITRTEELLNEICLVDVVGCTLNICFLGFNMMTVRNTIDL